MRKLIEPDIRNRVIFTANLQNHLDLSNFRLLIPAAIASKYAWLCRLLIRCGFRLLKCAAATQVVVDEYVARIVEQVDLRVIGVVPGHAAEVAVGFPYCRGVAEIGGEQETPPCQSVEQSPYQQFAPAA